jgi:flavin-dependent dehydrogenase
VLVLERERFPRFHIGESLLPFARDIWEELGVLDEIDRRFIHKPGARFIHNESGEEFTYYFNRAVRPGRPYAYEVPRSEFDHLLLQNARKLGAEVREESEVRDVAIDGDGVRVSVQPAGGAEYTATAQVFVDATGRDTLLGSRYGLKVTDELVTTNVACFTHFENARRQSGSDEGNITIVLFDGGWWWFIPFLGKITSVGCVLQKEFTLSQRGLSPEELFQKALDHSPEMARLLDGATRVRPVGTTGNWSYRCKQFYGDRFLLVGDAAAFIDPLFSTGVLMAVSAAKFAAQAIDGAFAAADFSAERFAQFEKQTLAGADLFKRLVHEFYGENLRKLLLHSETQSGLAAVITSLLAGDVYRPALWHNLVRKGFSHLIESPRPLREPA